MFNWEKALIAEEAAREAFKKYEGIDMTQTPLFTFPGNHRKALYGENTAVFEEAILDGKTVIKVTPNTVNPGSDQVVMDYSGLKIEGKDLRFVRFLAVNYKFECNTSKRGTPDKMHILMMPSSGALTKWINTKSASTIKENEWDKVIFDLNDFKTCVDTGKGAYLDQFHFYPFGRGVDPKTLSAGEVMYIGDFEFWGDYPGGRKFNVSFDCDIADAKGTDPLAFDENNDAEITLPENPYTVGNSKFLGWRRSYDGRLYAPGEVVRFRKET